MFSFFVFSFVFFFSRSLQGLERSFGGLLVPRARIRRTGLLFKLPAVPWLANSHKEAMDRHGHGLGNVQQLAQVESVSLRLQRGLSKATFEESVPKEELRTGLSLSFFLTWIAGTEFRLNYQDF